MWNQSLVNEWRTPYKPVPVKAVKVPLTPAETSIAFNRNDRRDIDTKGYKAYLYHFNQTTEVQDKEIYSCIISAVSMDEAIKLFVADAVRPDDYINAVIDVTLMGIDLDPDRSNKWVMKI